jgi:hypothetical protein
MTKQRGDCTETNFVGGVIFKRDMSQFVSTIDVETNFQKELVKNC